MGSQNRLNMTMSPSVEKKESFSKSRLSSSLSQSTPHLAFQEPPKRTRPIGAPENSDKNSPRIPHPRVSAIGGDSLKKSVKTKTRKRLTKKMPLKKWEINQNKPLYGTLPAVRTARYCTKYKSWVH
jgi:hypothetical protein